VAVSSQDELRKRIDAIENAYEFMLAYAAQGLSTHQASNAGAELRSFLGAAEEAIDRLPDLFAAVVADRNPEDSGPFDQFVEVLREDSRRAGAAVRLTLAQPAISSQLIDNLNASIHLRTLLTDVFLLDEVIEPRSAAGSAA
jgi:hypothetical protein